MDSTAACWLKDITAYCSISLPGSPDQTGRLPGAGGPLLQAGGSAAAPPEGTGSSPAPHHPYTDIHGKIHRTKLVIKTTYDILDNVTKLNKI